MRVRALSLRDFRGYEDARLELGRGLTVLYGPNGAGKTNLLEAVYFACTGRSCRTNNEREIVRFGRAAARVELVGEAEDGSHTLAVGFVPGEPKRMIVDGAPVERMLDVPDRPLVSVFLPDRLELIKGPPGLRRAHLDQFVAAMWPARAATRRAYSQTLAQRNALIARVRAGQASRETLGSWDQQLARHGVALMADRRQAVEALAEHYAALAEALGLPERAEVEYRPRSQATAPDVLAAELAERADSDIERGFTGHGPHRDEVRFRHGGHELRVYGSQGQQRLALLALLLAEREELGGVRDDAPLMLLDDVMSELDATRRQALVELLDQSRGQAILTTTELEHVPEARARGLRLLAVAPGHRLEEVVPA